MFADCSSKLGFPPPRHEAVVIEYPYKESQYPMSDIFSDGDISDIQSVGARTYKYVELMIKQSSLDVRRSLKLGQIGSLQTPSHDFQFTVRNAVRTLFAGVETIIGGAQFFLEAAKRRKEITLSETDINFLSGGKIEDKFVSVLTIFSREFGNDYIPDTTGPLWKEFRGARFFRDRLTHPKDPHGLLVDIESFWTLSKAADYFIGAFKALTPNFVKFTIKSRLFEKLIEEHNADRQGSTMNGEPLEIFYRVLYTQGHYERWAYRAFTSSHYMAPNDWERRFQERGSLNEADYDRLGTHLGEMTERALQTWLELKRRGTNASTEEEKFALGEAPGVFAYCTARQTLDNHPCSPGDPIVRFVAFRGHYIGPCAPEKDKGGVVATVEEILCPPLTRVQFEERFA